MEFGEGEALAQLPKPKSGQPLFTNRKALARITPREKQPWPKAKPFKILSLDGGGIRGIYTASLLDQIQRGLGENNHVVDYFDLVAGTSTGGIIALALGLGRSTASILEFYRCDGKVLFPPRNALGNAAHHVRKFFHPACDASALSAILYREFKDRIVGESTCRLVIPSFTIPNTTIAVIKTDHHRDYERDWCTAAWEAARATSAAPAFFEGHASGGEIFLDGGIWANNPTMVAITEALSSYAIELSQISVLSIGTGNVPFSINEVAARGGMLAWHDVIYAAMYLSTDNADSQAKLLLGHDRVCRIEPELRSTIELDDWQTADSILPNLAAVDYNANAARVGEFFREPAAPRERYYYQPTA